MGLAAFTVNPQSKEIEGALIKMLLQNHNRALQLEDQNIEVSKERIEPNSQAIIDLGTNSLKDNIDTGRGLVSR